MKKSDVLMICAVVYGAPQLDPAWAAIGFTICFVGWLFFAWKGW